MTDIINIFIGAAILIWSVVGAVVGFEYLFKPNNYKQKIFVYIIGGPILWIGTPFMMIVIGLVCGVAFIYNSLGDKRK